MARRKTDDRRPQIGAAITIIENEFQRELPGGESEYCKFALDHRASVGLVVIVPRCKVVRGNLAEQFERSREVFDQVIENERVDYLVLPNIFHSFGHRLMKVSYARDERRIGI